MTAQEALQEAERRGIVLTPSGTTLHLRGPRDALTDLKHELGRHKQTIIRLLGGGPPTCPCPTCRQFAFPEAGTACHWCRKGRREA